jgi:hypothetical protein
MQTKFGPLGGGEAAKVLADIRETHELLEFGEISEPQARFGRVDAKTVSVERISGQGVENQGGGDEVFELAAREDVGQRDLVRCECSVAESDDIRRRSPQRRVVSGPVGVDDAEHAVALFKVHLKDARGRASVAVGAA